MLNIFKKNDNLVIKGLIASVVIGSVFAVIKMVKKRKTNVDDTQNENKEMKSKGE